MGISRARRASNQRNAQQRRKANKESREDFCPTSTEVDDYDPDSAFIIAANVIDKHLPTLARLQELVPDHAKHSAGPRGVPVRLLLISIIALALQGKAPHLKRIAASLCSHRRVNSGIIRRLRKKTRRVHLQVPDDQYVSYAMVQHTLSLLGKKLKTTITIETKDGKKVKDTLLNILGIDLPQAAIAASGDADLYKDSTSIAVDTTIIDAYVAHVSKVDDKTGEIIKLGYDPDARNNYRTRTRRDRQKNKVSYKLEGLVAVRDLAPNRSRHSLLNEPYPGTAVGARFHNEKHSGEETIAAIRLLHARGHIMQTCLNDRGYSTALSTRWSAPLRALGLEPVHDLTKTQRGRRPFIHTFKDDEGNPTTAALDSLDGTLFENHVVDHLEKTGHAYPKKTEWIAKAKDRDARKGNTKATDRRKATIKIYDERAIYALVPHDRIGPWTARYRGPAHKSNPTAWCANWPSSHRHQNRLPKTPCKPDQNCNCARLVTVRLDPENDTHEQFNKIRQTRPWGTSGWHAEYNGRSLAESHFSAMRGNYSNNAQPLDTRVSGTEKRGLVKLLMMCADNIRLIAAHRIKRGLEPNPDIEATVHPPTPPDATKGTQPDTPPPGDTDPPNRADKTNSTP